MILGLRWVSLTLLFLQWLFFFFFFLITKMKLIGRWNYQVLKFLSHESDKASQIKALYVGMFCGQHWF